MRTSTDIRRFCFPYGRAKWNGIPHITATTLKQEHFPCLDHNYLQKSNFNWPLPHVFPKKTKVGTSEVLSLVVIGGQGGDVQKVIPPEQQLIYVLLSPPPRKTKKRHPPPNGRWWRPKKNNYFMVQNCKTLVAFGGPHDFSIFPPQTGEVCSPMGAQKPKQTPGQQETAWTSWTNGSVWVICRLRTHLTSWTLMAGRRALLTAAHRWHNGGAQWRWQKKKSQKSFFCPTTMPI